MRTENGSDSEHLTSTKGPGLSLAQPALPPHREHYKSSLQCISIKLKLKVVTFIGHLQSRHGTAKNRDSRPG